MFWVAGTGNWSDATNHWSTTSGGAPGAGNLPTAADDAIFDANSNTSNAAYTVTFNAPAKVCKDLIFSAKPGDGLGGTITWAGTQSATISGSLTCLAGMTLTYVGAITFNATSAGKTVTMNGVTLGSSVTFSGVGGGWTLQDSFTATGGSVVLSNGSLDTNGMPFSAFSFSSTGAGTRALSLGASSVTLTATTTAWLADAALSLTAGSSTIKLTGASGNKTFSGGGLVYWNLELTGNAAGSTSVVSSNTFNDLKYVSSGTTYLIKFQFGTTTTFTTFTVSGTSGHLVTITSTNPAATHTLAKATLGGNISCDYLSIDHSIASPASTWFAGANSTNGGNNTDWTFGAISAADYSLLAYWMGGAGSTPSLATAGYRSFGAYWMGGAASSTPLPPSTRHPDRQFMRNVGRFMGI